MSSSSAARDVPPREVVEALGLKMRDLFPRTATADEWEAPFWVRAGLHLLAPSKPTRPQDCQQSF